ncbi:MAG: deoxyribonuclease IV [Candidatus Sabulitectum sp.]|nr:deoxyribonuclease IV [Candidatus Sabulitectum sp.]
MIPGIHVSTAGGIYRAPLKLREMGFSTGQIFTANQRRWKNGEISPADTAKFRDAAEGLTIISHASYLINLSSADPEVVEKSHIALLEELNRCKTLGIPYLVMHPGAHQKAGLEKGIEMISYSLRQLLPAVKAGPMLLLENTAGAGTTIGCRLEELAAIRDSSGISGLIGYCIDTAHAHGAGYKITNSGTVSVFVEQLDSILGSGNIKAFHLNDSKVECDSRRDRHEHFGEGTIGLDGLRYLFRAPLLSQIPGIAETPGTDDERAADIRKLSQ